MLSLSCLLLVYVVTAESGLQIKTLKPGPREYIQPGNIPHHPWTWQEFKQNSVVYGNDRARCCWSGTCSSSGWDFPTLEEAGRSPWRCVLKLCCHLLGKSGSLWPRNFSVAFRTCFLGTPRLWLSLGKPLEVIPMAQGAINSASQVKEKIWRSPVIFPAACFPILCSPWAEAEGQGSSRWSCRVLYGFRVIWTCWK